MNDLELYEIVDFLDDDDEDNEDEGQANSSRILSPSPPSQQSSYHSSQPERTYNFVKLVDKKKAVEYWKSGKTKKLDFTTVQHRFKFVRNPQNLYNWEEQIEQKGSRNDKLMKIWKRTLADFRKAKRERLPVHDSDLRRFALKANRIIGLDNFGASLRWVHKFKKLNRIVSRKITKFVTEKSILEEADIQKLGEDFVKEARLRIAFHGVEDTKNTDQSEFNREMHSGRRLDIKGVKHVESKMQSANAMTHSYTIQPVVSAAGVLSPKMLVVIQESSGKFGPKVSKDLSRPDNLLIRASKSGKLDKAILKDFYTEVLFPDVADHGLLLVDSWSAHTDKKLVEDCQPLGVELEVLIMPPGTTGKVQPLDVYGFRLWKGFVRFVSDRVLIDDIPLILHQRNALIQLQSLTHNQMSSPRYHATWRYGWYKAGYLDDHPPEFVTPTEFCFKGPEVDAGHKCNKCDDLHFIKCSWCKQIFCFAHWWGLDKDGDDDSIECHYCNDYVN